MPFFYVWMWYITFLRLNLSHTCEDLSTEQPLNLSHGRAEVTGLSWLQDASVKWLQILSIGVVMILCVGWVFCFGLGFLFLYIVLCICVLLFSCPSCCLCCWSPPPPCSILALSRLTHPSCPTQAIPPLLPCPLHPSSSFLLPRKQPML